MEWAVRQPPAREGINAPYARNISWTLLSGEGFTPAPGTGPAYMGLGHQRLRERQGRGPGPCVGAQLLDLGSLHVGQADSTTGAASLCPTRCMGSGQDWSHMETPKAALLRQGRGTLCSLLWQGFLPPLYLFPNLAEDGRFHGGSLSK